MRLFKHPIRKLSLITFFGGGYVLGAKAGRERYEQIRKAAEQVKSDPRVQQATAKAEDVVRETASKVSDDPRFKDVVARAQEVASDVAGTAGSAASSAADTASEVASDVSDAAAKAAPDTTTDTTIDTAPVDQPISALLADDHVETAEEIVYSSGPDIEETVDELNPDDDSQRL